MTNEIGYLIELIYWRFNFTYEPKGNWESLIKETAALARSKRERRSGEANIHTHKLCRAQFSDRERAGERNQEEELRARVKKWRERMRARNSLPLRCLWTIFQ